MLEFCAPSLRHSRAGGNPVAFVNFLRPPLACRNVGWAEFSLTPASCGVAGGCPAATHFSCFAKKSKQKKATPGSSALRATHRNTGTTGRFAKLGLEWADELEVEFVLVLKHAKRTAPVVPVLLGDSHGGVKSKSRSKPNHCQFITVALAKAGVQVRAVTRIPAAACPRMPGSGAGMTVGVHVHERDVVVRRTIDVLR